MRSCRLSALLKHTQLIIRAPFKCCTCVSWAVFAQAGDWCEMAPCLCAPFSNVSCRSNAADVTWAGQQLLRVCLKKSKGGGGRGRKDERDRESVWLSGSMQSIFVFFRVLLQKSTRLLVHKWQSCSVVSQALLLSLPDCRGSLSSSN